MTKRDDELIYQWQQSSSLDFWRGNIESDVYKTTKALRESQAKLNVNDITTAGELILNKPKEGSAAGALLPFTQTPELQQEVERVENQTFGERAQEKATSLFEENIIPTLKPVASTIGKVFDKVDDVIIKKPIAATSALISVPYFNAKEAYRSIREGDDFSFLRAGEEWEDNKTRIEYLFGSNLEMGDYLDPRTATEKRQEQLASFNPEAAAEIEEKMGGYTMVADVVSGVAAGVLTGSALSKLALQGGRVGQIGKALDKTIDPNLTNMAKMGALFGATAIPYYGLTGKWMFEGDVAATEGASIMLGGLGLKGLGEGFKATKDVLKDPSFQKGLGDFFERFAQFSGAKTNLLDESKIIRNVDTLSPKERSGAFNLTQELRALQESEKELGKGFKFDTPSNPQKLTLVEELEGLGLMEFKGLDGSKGYSYKYTDEGMKLILGKNFDKSKGNVGVHYPVDLYKEVKGELKNLPPKAPIDNTRSAKLNESGIEEQIKRSDTRVKKENFIEKRAKDLGLWNENKGSWYNQASFIYNRSLGKIYKNQAKVYGSAIGDTGVDLKLNKVQRPVRDTLEQANLFGRLDNIKNKVNEVAEIVGDDWENFNQYLWAKNRYFKTIGKEIKGEKLETAQLVNGKMEQLSSDDLKGMYESYGSKFESLADTLHATNRKVLDYEVEAGSITRETADKYMKDNPFFIPDKLSAFENEALIKDSKFSNVSSPFHKKLKEGSVATDYSKEAVNNLYQSMAVRMRFAAKNNHLKVMNDVSVDKGFARIVEEGQIARRGYVVDDVYINGERKLMEIPKFYKEALDANDVLTLSTFKNIASIPASIVKFQSTGPYNFVFQAKAPFYEVPLGLMKNKSNGGKASDYLKSLFRTEGSLMGTPQGKEAMRALIKDFGGDFSGLKLYEREFNATLGKADKEYIKKLNKTKFTKARHSLESVGHNIELYSTRIPLFEASLKKQGIDNKKWKELVGKATNVNDQLDSNKLAKLLSENGYSAKEAGNTARSLFDYNIASKQISTISRYAPYLNTTVSGAVSLGRLWEDAPKQFISYLGGMATIGQLMTAFNHGTAIPGVLEENPRKAELMAKQPDYVRNKVGLVWIDEESGKVDVVDVLGNNIQMLEWIYPMAVDVATNGKIGIEGANRIVKDLTYFGDLTKPGFVDLSRTPPGIKQGLEVLLNKDFFYDSEIVNKYKQRPGYETEEYSRYTNPLIVKASKMFALLTGGEEGVDGVVEGGTQWSPAKMERLWSVMDVKGTLTDALAVVMNEFTEVGITKSNVKDFTKIMNKSYRLQTTEFVDDAELKDISHKAIHKDRINATLLTTETLAELKVEGQVLIDKYKELPGYEEIYKPILEKQLEDRTIYITYGANTFWDTKKTSKEFSVLLKRLYDEGGVEEVNRKIDDVKATGVFSKAKWKNIEGLFTESLKVDK